MYHDRSIAVRPFIFFFSRTQQSSLSRETSLTPRTASWSTNKHSLSSYPYMTQVVPRDPTRLMFDTKYFVRSVCEVFYYILLYYILFSFLPARLGWFGLCGHKRRRARKEGPRRQTRLLILSSWKTQFNDGPAMQAKIWARRKSRLMVRVSANRV